MLRARLGAALRSRPSALQAPEAATALAPPPADVTRLAAELERMAPGLALMLQLRARLFDDAAIAASSRGTRHLVSIGAGFDDRRLGVAGIVPGRVWEVDHPDVLEAKPVGSAGIERLPVEDLDAMAWPALLARAPALARERTLFLIHNPSLWSFAPPLACWLPGFAAAAAPGSEVLLNVLGGDAAARDAVARMVPGGAASRGSGGLAALHARIEALRLETLGAWDTGALQRAYLGRDDLLPCELYVWIGTRTRPGRAPPAPGDLAALVGEGRLPIRAAPIAGRDRRLPPRHDGVTGPPAGTTKRALRRVTPLRWAGVAPGVGAVEEESGTLIDHPPVRVLAGRAADRWAQGVATEASLLLHQIACLLRCQSIPPTLVDVSSEDSGRPRTYVDVAAPYTLVQIPAPVYSRHVLAHELTHVLANARSPWLSEGLAVWVQRRLAPGPCFPDDLPPSLSGADEGGDGLTLAVRLGRPSAAPVALRPLLVRPGRSAYRRAAGFVGYCVDHFGLTWFLDLFRACSHVAADDAITRACRRVGCASLAELEARWCGATRPTSEGRRRRAGTP